jgi:hypothetical protein
VYGPVIFSPAENKSNVEDVPHAKDIAQTILSKYRINVSDYADYIRGPNTDPKLVRLMGLFSRVENVEHRKRREEFLWAEGDITDRNTGSIDSAVSVERETLQDIVAEAAKTVGTEAKSDAYAGIEDKLSLDEFMARPVRVGSLIYGIGDTSLYRYRVFDILGLDAAVRRKLINASTIKCDLEIDIRVTSSPFHYGSILASWQPYDQRNATLTSQSVFALSHPTSDLFKNYQSQSRYAMVMNTGKNRSYTMTIPYLGMNTAYRLFNETDTTMGDLEVFEDLSEAGALLITPINPISAAAPDATNVSVQIYARMINVSLGQPTGTLIEVQAEGKVDKEPGPLERISSAVAMVSGALTQVPSIGVLATPVHIAANAVSSIAHMFGWSYPITQTSAHYMKPVSMQNGAQCAGESTAKKICVDPNQSMTVDPRILGIVEDELVISNMAGRNTYLTTFEWSPDDTVDDTLFKMAVTPQLSTIFVDGLEKYVQPTAAAYAVQPFNYWSGVLEVRFDIVSSAYHGGRLRIVHEPNVYQDTVINDSLNTGYNKQRQLIVDIRETSTITFCVSMSHIRQWLKVLNPDSLENLHGFSIASGLYNYINGMIYVRPVNTLQSNGQYPVYINVYVRMKDLEVNFLDNEKIPLDRIMNPETLVAEGLVMEEPVTCLDLNQQSPLSRDSAVLHFGERPLSFRALLKRFYRTGTADTLAIAGSPGATRITNGTYPFAYPFMEQAETDASGASVYGYLRPAFMTLSGSVRKRIKLVRALADNPFMLQWKVTLNPEISTFGSLAVAELTTMSAAESRGTVTHVARVNDALEVEFPMYYNCRYLFSFADNLIGTNDSGASTLVFFKRYHADVDHTGVAGPGKVVEETCFGEDFTFRHWTGAPPYHYS